MNLPYQIVNNCLLVLKSLELPRVEKLQIEIELLQVKRLLLVLGWESSRSGFLNNIDFEALEAAFTADRSTGEKEDSAELLATAKNLRAAFTAELESFLNQDCI